MSTIFPKYKYLGDKGKHSKNTSKGKRSQEKGRNTRKPPTTRYPQVQKSYYLP